mgnify:CR=1 FL=1
MSENTGLVEETAYWLIPLQGRTVTQCQIDYGFTLVFLEPDAPMFTIRIEGKFVLGTDRGKSWLCAREDPTALGPALGLLNQKVESVVAYKNGDLEVTFAYRTNLCVPPDSNYEAWQVTGPGGLLLVSLPGGGLSVWRAR